MLPDKKLDKTPDKLIHDAIWGPVRLPQLVWNAVDTKFVQRLKNIKQTGISSEVYPSATHTRFVHSVGVAHLAFMFIQYLNEKLDNKVSIRHQNLVCLAGLFHDLGHGPFSHLWDQFTESEHEVRSCKMIYELCTKTKKHEIGLTLDETLFVISLVKCNINGLKKKIWDEKTQQRFEEIKREFELPFLYEIVANENCGLDVDKLDYLARDGVHTEQFISATDVKRLLMLADVSTDKKHIVFPLKAKANIQKVFSARWHMHKQVYQHKTTKAFDFMISKAFELIADVFHFENDDFETLDDGILSEIKRRKDKDLDDKQKENLKQAKQLLYAISERGQPRMILEKTPLDKQKYEHLKEKLGKDVIKKAIIKKVSELDKNISITEDELIVIFGNYGYGNIQTNNKDNKKKNPLENIKYKHEGSPDGYTTISIKEYYNINTNVHTDYYFRIYKRNQYDKDIASKAATQWYNQTIYSEDLPDSRKSDNRTFKTPAFSLLNKRKLNEETPVSKRKKIILKTMTFYHI